MERLSIQSKVRTVYGNVDLTIQL